MPCLSKSCIVGPAFFTWHVLDVALPWLHINGILCGQVAALQAGRQHNLRSVRCALPAASAFSANAAQVLHMGWHPMMQSLPCQA